MTRDFDALIADLTLEEKAALTAGEDMFSTPAIERAGIAKVHLTDGPSGARGALLPGVGFGDPASCIPCGSAVGATWDRELAHALGALVGQEAFDRSCLGLLAPTVNLHRSPLAGRNFECYSEDPLLSGKLAAGFIRGVQSKGVFATVKHFVGNEAEFERSSISSVIDHRSLRELYLLPFELAVREGGVQAVMTSYNRLNGQWVTEQGALLIDLLRDEWGFDGLVMTDWYAVADTETSLAAGLDLEMPGPGKALGASLVEAIRTGTVEESHLDAAVRRLLTTYDRFGILDDPAPAYAPVPVDEAGSALLRRAAAEATVLLRNDGTLPLDTTAMRTIALLGPNAARPNMVGGGSAGLLAWRTPDVVTALTEAVGDAAQVVHERACEIGVGRSSVGSGVLPSAEGFDVEFFRGHDLGGDPIESRHVDELQLMILPFGEQTLPAEGEWSCHARGVVTAEETGTFRLVLTQCGPTKVLVDGDLVVDGFDDAPPAGSTDYFGEATKEVSADFAVTAGRPLEIEIRYEASGGLDGFRLGFATADQDALMQRAVDAAAAADVAVLVVGTSAEWETEGRDRSTLSLPDPQDELVRRVAAVNPRTVVIVNAGAPIELPWIDDVAAVMQCWLGGQELDHALADILTGAVEPGGRLATTLPRHLRHNPAHDNFPGENGEVRYGEGLFMGYRGYEHRGIAPLFPFGHGLGYTTFEIGPPTLSQSTFTRGGTVTISVPVTNTGDRAGAEVVQCYVAPEAPRLARPDKELKAFSKVRLEPGGSTVIDLVLDDRSFAYWDPGQPDFDAVCARGVDHSGTLVERRSPGWQVDAGRYQVLIGRSSTDIIATLDLDVAG